MTSKWIFSMLLGDPIIHLVEHQTDVCRSLNRGTSFFDKLKYHLSSFIVRSMKVLLLEVKNVSDYLFNDKLREYVKTSSPKMKSFIYLFQLTGLFIPSRKATKYVLIYLLFFALNIF